MTPSKSAFTLLEILIVLLLTGLVYMLAVTSFDSDRKFGHSTYSFKKQLLSYKDDPASTLEFVDTGTEYMLLLDGKILDHDLEVPNDARFYLFDQSGQEITRFQKRPVGGEMLRCEFVYTLFEGGAARPLVVYTGGTYSAYLPTALEPLDFDNLQDAKEAAMNNAHRQSLEQIDA